jgi:hypothetical protein
VHSGLPSIDEVFFPTWGLLFDFIRKSEQRPPGLASSPQEDGEGTAKSQNLCRPVLGMEDCSTLDLVRAPSRLAHL